MNALKIFCILLGFVSLTYAQEVKDSITEVNYSYVMRFAWKDTSDNLNIYGISFASAQRNKTANISGLAFNFVLGGQKMLLSENADCNISVNGINISLFMTATSGTINGFTFGGLFGNSAKEVNGISTGILGTRSGYQNGIAMGILVAQSEYFNGFAIAGIGAVSQYANGVQIGGIVNACHKLNGIGAALINASDSVHTMINGLIIGGYNGVDVNGLSIGIVNNGNSWLQIGLVNMGDSTVQIGLVNLDEKFKMDIPLINVNF